MTAPATDARRVSPATWRLLRQLAATPGWPARLLQRAGPQALLDDIVASGEAEAALWLLPIAVRARDDARERVLDALDRLVRAASPATLIWLEQEARTRPGWREEDLLVAEEVTPARAAALPPSPASAAGVASLHGRGWVREAAVRVLAASADPLAVAFLLLRANDWVAQVRDAALAGLDAQLSRQGAAPFATYLELVDRLSGARRNDLGAIAGRILASLASPAASEALQRGCASPSRTVRRRCTAIALEARTFDLRDVVRRGLDDPDPVIRSTVARGAAKALPPEALDALLPAMLASRSPAPRHAALAALWERSGAASREVQERFLVDPHPHVRGTARWFLKTLPGFDSAAAYRAALPQATSRDALVGALQGLGEVGAAADAALVEPHLADPRPRVRAAALTALGTLGSAAHREAVVLALSDPSPRVTRIARSILLRGAPVDPDRLTFAALRGRHPHERSAAVDLARAHDHWTAGLLLLRIARGADADTAARAARALAAWDRRYNSVFTHPTAAQVAEYAALVEAAPLEAALAGRLRFLVAALAKRGRSG